MRITPGLRAAALVVAIAWRTHAAQAQLTALGSQLWSQASPGITGAAEADDAFGEALAVGDFDCDGFDDLAVGMPHEDIELGNDTYANAGAVQVFYGGPAGTADSGRDEIITQEAAMAETLPNADYSEPGDHFGWAVAAYASPGCGPHLAVGAPDEDSFGHVDTGKVFLFKYSQESGHFEYLRAVTQDQIGGPFEEEDSDQFGYAIAEVDLPGTGSVDCPPGFGASVGLAIGAPGEGIDFPSIDQGAVYVIRSGFCTPPGAAANWEFEIDDCVDLRDVQCLIFTQEDFGHDPESGDRFGANLSARSQGRLIIASPGEDDGEGIVQVYNDSDPSQNITQSSLAHGASEAHDNFGAALAEGDFDGDGELDLAIGVPGENVNSNSVTNGGAVAVVYAPLLAGGDDYFDQDVSDDTSPEDFDQFGASLAAGDFNGDGIDDLAIGAPGEDAGSTVDAGAFHVLYGDVTGLLTAGNQTFTQNSANVPSSAEPCDGLAMVLATGNFDGANGSDLAAGVPGEDGVCATLPPSPLPFPDDNEGAVNVLYSSLGGHLSQISASFSPSPVNEGAGSTTLTLTKTGSSVVAASVKFVALPDTAEKDVDFQAFSGTAAWAAGDSSALQFQLSVIDDPNDEPSEFLNLNLLLPSAGAHIVDDIIPLTILDNDTFTTFADDFEASATDAWTSSFATGNTFQHTAVVRYAGDWGLRLLINDASAIYLQDELPFSSTYHARFYLRLLSIDAPATTNFVVFSAAGPAAESVFEVVAHYSAASDTWWLIARAFKDDGLGMSTSAAPFPPGRHAVEIFWQRGAAGQMSLKIDGTLEDTVTDIPNNSLRVDRVRLGAPLGFDAGVSGNFAIDEFASSASANLNQISAFLDVAEADTLWNFIHSMYNFEVTEGCQTGLGPLNFCKNDSVTREALAMLLIRASDGPAAPNPVSCGTSPFTDVAAGNIYCRFIQEIDNRGIANGCGGGNYCPKNPIRRGELAVLLLRTLDGGGATPAPCTTKPFTDVETNDLRCPFIQEIKQRSISNGCGGGNYCPDQPVRRQELAILLQRAFGYRLPVSP